MRHCRSCKYRHMDIKALQYCNVVADKCEMTGNLVITPFFDGFMCKFYKKRFDYPREEPQIKPDRRRALVDGLLILASVVMLLVVICAAWSCYDHLGWVRFVMRLPAPGWLKMWLWRW